MVHIPPRSEARIEFSAATRIQLAENDLDAHDRAIASIDAKLDRILWAAVSMMIAGATSAVMMALNLVVK